MTQFSKFQESYNKAIETIELMLVPSEYEPPIHGLVKWMLETDANPYSYLPEYWAGRVGSAEGFAGLLEYIYHAVYDDGDITFVTVDDEPRIVFAYQSEENFRNSVLTKQEQDLEKRPVFGVVRERAIKVIDIEPDDFPGIYKDWQIKDLQRCFAVDAARMGLDFAIKHYSEYQCYSDTWPAECKDEISKWEKVYQNHRQLAR